VQLVGRPDYLVEAPDGSVIPVEVKSGRAPAAPYDGHILQLAAYCYLVAVNYGKRPSYGILQYRNRAFAIDYTDDLESDLLDVLADMQAALQAEDIDRDHNDWRRCARCGVRGDCYQRLA
jgi:CRISPR-associated exonuclease Cas4